MPNDGDQLPICVLGADEVLVQFGIRLFHNAPGPNDEGRLSLCWGPLSAAAVTYLVTNNYRTRCRPGVDLVRQTTVARILNADSRFHVRHDPLLEHPLHVTVEFDGAWAEGSGAATLFAGCFVEGG